MLCRSHLCHACSTRVAAGHGKAESMTLVQKVREGLFGGSESHWIQSCGGRVLLSQVGFEGESVIQHVLRVIKF